MDLPTLGTNPKWSRNGSTTQEAKDLAILRSAGRTVREPGADSPLPTGGRSVNRNRTTRRAPQHADGPYLVPVRSASNSCRAESPRSPGGQSGHHADGPIPLHGRSDKPPAAKFDTSKDLRASSQELDEHATNLHSRTVRGLGADSPPALEQNSPGWKPRSQPPLSQHGSPKRLELLRKDLGKMWSVPRGCYAPNLGSSNELNRQESNRHRTQPKIKVPTEILQSEAELGVWGIKIKHKDAWSNYPWFPPTNPSPNTSESKE
jgi:hypothetical protein